MTTTAVIGGSVPYESVAMIVKVYVYLHGSRSVTVIFPFSTVAGYDIPSRVTITVGVPQFSVYLPITVLVSQVRILLIDVTIGDTLKDTCCEYGTVGISDAYVVAYGYVAVIVPIEDTTGNVAIITPPV